MPRIRRPHFAAALVSVIVAACSGGGGDDSGPPAAPTFNAAAAYRSLLTTANDWRVTGTDSQGVTAELRFITTPGTAANFPVTGIPGRRAVFGSEIRNAGQLISTNALTYYFNDTTTGLVGIENTVDQTCEVPVDVATLPTSARAGESGSVATINPYNGCLTTSVPVAGALYTLGWSIESDAGVYLFCLNVVRRAAPPNGNVLGTESDCFETSAAGTLGTRARITLTQPPANYTMVAKNY